MSEPQQLPHPTEPPPQPEIQAGVTQEEEEDMQDWVCLPEAELKGFSQAEGSSDLGACSLDSFSDSNDNSPSFIPPEETRGGRSEIEEDNFELSDDRLEDAEEEQHDEDCLDLKCVSELKETGLGDVGRLEAGSVCSDERSEVPGQDLAKTKDIVESANGLTDGDGGSESEASGLSEKKEEDGETNEQPEERETRAADTEESMTSSDSLQAVTLLFYVLTFLVILQRVWAYIGCFICT